MPLNERIHRTACSTVVAVLLLTTACTELITPPQGVLHADASPRKTFTANPDGTYTWDGTSVPAGDESPAEILSATAGGYAPHEGTGGWVAATMNYTNGDQYKMDLTYSVMNTMTHQPLYSSSSTSTNWTYGLSGSNKYYNLDLHLLPLCGYSLTNGGTAYARKALPFRISANLLKLPSSISIGLGTITWGDAAPMAMTAFSDPGIACSPEPPPVIAPPTGGESPPPVNYTPPDPPPLCTIVTVIDSHWELSDGVWNYIEDGRFLACV